MSYWKLFKIILTKSLKYGLAAGMGYELHEQLADAGNTDAVVESLGEFLEPQEKILSGDDDVAKNGSRK